MLLVFILTPFILLFILASLATFIKPENEIESL